MERRTRPVIQRYPGVTPILLAVSPAPGLTPGNLIIHLRKLEEAGYVSSEKTRNGSAPKTTVALTSQGRAALDAYTRSLRDLLNL